MAELLGESWVRQVDLKELDGCLDGLLHEHEVLCEGRQRLKERGGEVIRVGQKNGTGKGKEGNKVTE